MHMDENWWSKDQLDQMNVNKETEMDKTQNQGVATTIRLEEAVKTLLEQQNNSEYHRGGE